MKKFLKLFGCLSVAGCLLLGKMDIYAAEPGFVELPMEEVQIVTSLEDEGISPASTESLAGCQLGIGIASNGVSVTFTTRSTATASEIGVKNVVLQEKNGSGWRDIPISKHYTSGKQEYTGGVVYTGAQAGRTYRVSCTHYAIINGTEYTLYNSTNNLVYN